jgi:hypothetical protein
MRWGTRTHKIIKDGYVDAVELLVPDPFRCSFHDPFR